MQNLFNKIIAEALSCCGLGLDKVETTYELIDTETGDILNDKPIRSAADLFLETAGRLMDKIIYDLDEEAEEYGIKEAETFIDFNDWADYFSGDQVPTEFAALHSFELQVCDIIANHIADLKIEEIYKEGAAAHRKITYENAIDEYANPAYNIYELEGKKYKEIIYAKYDGYDLKSVAIGEDNKLYYLYWADYSGKYIINNLELIRWHDAYYAAYNCDYDDRKET